MIGVALLSIGFTTQAASIVPAEIGLALTGMGLATCPLMRTAIGTVPAGRSRSAASLINVARMISATLGVAAHGAIFAVVEDAPQGSRRAMFLGGGIQIAAAGMAWLIGALADDP